MTKEIEAMRKPHEARKTVKNCTKALYLIGDLKHVYYYLEAMTEIGEIAEEEADAILGEVSKECAGLMQSEIEKVKNDIEKLSCFRTWIDKALQRPVARTCYVGTKGGRKVYEVLFTTGGAGDCFIDFDNHTVEEV